MRKRIGLFFVGLVVFLAGFGLYQWLTGASWMTPAVSPPAGPDVAKFPPNFATSYEFRTKSGELKYLITAQKLDPIRDAAGQPLPGQLLAQGAEGTFYSKDGRTVQIRADRCRLAVDQVPKSAKIVGTDTDLPPVQFRVATLSGHVLLTISAKPPGLLPPKPQDGELTVAFDGNVDVLPNQNLITSPGNVHVRSDTVSFDGGGLNLSYNRDEQHNGEGQRIEYLRIDRGNQVIIRGVGKKALALDNAQTASAAESGVTSGGTATASKIAVLPGSPAGSPAVAAVGPALPGVPSHPGVPGVATTKAATFKTTSYKLSFGDITATVGKQSLTADRLYVLFMPGNPSVTREPPADDAAAPVKGGAEPAEPSASAAAPALAGAQVITAATRSASTTLPSAEQTAAALAALASAPIAPPGPDDLVINWHGPMEMRPSSASDVQLTGGKDSALEALGTAAKPVILHDAARTVTATGEGGRLWYHTAADRVEIQPGKNGAVQMVDATQGSMTCQGVTFLRDAKPPVMMLDGPGEIDVPQSAMKGRIGSQNQGPLHATWQGHGNIELASDPHAANKETIRHALLTGKVAIDDPAFQLHTDSLDFTMARTGDAKTPQALEHLLASGNVHIKYARANAGLDDAAKPEGINSDNLEVFTAPGPGTTIPEPSRVLATGHVTAWTYSDQKDQGDDAAALVHSAKSDKRLMRETIHTPRLDVALKPRDKSAPGDTATTGLALGMQAGLKSLVASQGVTVEMEGFEGAGQRVVTATAQTLTVDGTKSAVLDGDFGMGQPNGIPKRVVILQGANRIIGDKILLDQKAHTIDVPGPGEADFVDAGKKGQPDATVKTTWSQRMGYDEKLHTARFLGNVVSRREAGPDSLSELSCKDSMVIVLAASSSQKPAGEARESARFDRITAKGDVLASGTTFDPATHSVLTAVATRANELLYSAATDTLRIPVAGTLTLEDYRPDKTAAPANPDDDAPPPATKPKDKDKQKEPDAKGITVFRWDTSLVYAGHKGKVDPGTIKMKGNVWMKHVPIKPFQLAGADGKSSPIKDMLLHADSLTAYLAQTPQTGGSQSVASPVGLGSGGDVKFARAVADGNAELNLGDDGISGDSLDFDSVKRLAVARGKNGVDATARSPDKGMVSSPEDITWNLATNTFSIPHPRGVFQIH